MTREEKIKKLLALEELQRRKLTAKPKYTPHAEQMKVHMSSARFRWVLSGNGFGKSALLVNELWAAATGYNPWRKEHTKVPLRMVLVVDNTAKIDSVIIPEFKKWYSLPQDMLKKDGKPHTNRMVWPNGSELLFISQEADPAVTEGRTIHFIAADEPLPKHLFIGLTRGGREKGAVNRWLYCGTPLSQPWLRIDIYDPWVRGELAEHECFRGSTEANRANLDSGYIERFKKLLSEDEQRVRLEGAFFDSGGMALAHLWNRDVHIIPTNSMQWDMDSAPCVIGLDPHPSKSHVAVLMGADRDNYQYVLDELQKKLPAREYAEMLVEKWGAYRITDVICDSFGSADSTGQEGFKSFIDVLNEVFKEKGVSFRARPTTFNDKDDEDFISRLQDSLLIPETANNYGQKVPKLRVLSHCKLVIDNIENVGWQKDKRTGIFKPKLDITQQDGLACVKYALRANLHYERGRTKPSYVARPVYGLSTPTLRKAMRAKMRLGLKGPR